jgi:hypothetical protein
MYVIFIAQWDEYCQSQISATTTLYLNANSMFGQFIARYYNYILFITSLFSLYRFAIYLPFLVTYKIFKA